MDHPRSALAHTTQCCRQGCIIYSVGSQNVFDFEARLLNTTVCDIHVFDPTVKPSLLRNAEQTYNAGLPRQRLFVHSIGIRATDNAEARCACLPSARVCKWIVGALR